ncbi:DUF1376 domain-containing protein [Paracoccus liaowanqingii]|uniref:DUF1376 domain-containing protein n=1 Tax=Paracoccus liaowanqingii TaxID=2560053 RepID=A0A4P7HKB0_9RHOB|nr:DUF1376 domain-containing protein [Paracoccus liaowanqingii]QBX34608.1 DUF1376 domain-containing protein [Paracoccus liaowanqingii]
MSFNAKASRSKRPCPIWVDAFQRDTQHLEADEIGAYFLILMAMWTRESCDFPDDDNRLARVSRVSPRLWKSRIGPVIREFLTVEDGVVISKRLRQEATYVERQVKQQSDRKTGEKSDKPLNCNDVDQSADYTVDEPRHHPSQQPNNLHKESSSSSSSAREADGPPEKAADGLPEREGIIPRLTHALGFDHHGQIPKYWITTEAGMIVSRWRTDLALTDDEIVTVAKDSARAHGSPAKGPKVLNEAMAGYAAEKRAPPLRPSDNPRPADDRPKGHGIQANIPEKYRQ